MPSPLPSTRHNHILSALPAAEHARLRTHLELVDLPRGWMLCEAGAAFEWLYFPITGIVSLLHVMADGTAAEAAITGNDGMVGISLLMGGGHSPCRAIVEQAGQAYRIRAKSLRLHLTADGKLQHLAQQYAQSLLAQMAQTIVCNRHHSLEQQLCRWLLLRLDLLCGNALMMTQEQIAHTLGVRREGVTEAAGRLQARGLIQYNRGHITLLDRRGLEASACECHASTCADSRPA